MNIRDGLSGCPKKGMHALSETPQNTNSAMLDHTGISFIPLFFLYIFRLIVARHTWNPTKHWQLNTEFNVNFHHDMPESKILDTLWRQTMWNTLNSHRSTLQQIEMSDLPGHEIFNLHDSLCPHFDGQVRLPRFFNAKIFSLNLSASTEYVFVGWRWVLWILAKVD